MRHTLFLTALLTACNTPNETEAPNEASLSETSPTSVETETTGSTSQTESTGLTGSTTATTGSDTQDTGLPAAVCDGRTIGTTVGTCAQDFTLLDANGTAVTLSDFAGDVIVIDFSAMWCGFCQNLAPELQTLHETYAGQGLTVLTVLFQNIGGTDPSVEDLEDWVDVFGSTHVVLGDVSESTFGPYDAGGQPTGIVIDRNFDIVWVDAGAPVLTDVESQVTPLL